MKKSNIIIVIFLFLFLVGVYAFMRYQVHTAETILNDVSVNQAETKVTDVKVTTFKKTNETVSQKFYEPMEVDDEFDISGEEVENITID